MIIHSKSGGQIHYATTKPESGIYDLLESMPGGWWLSLVVLLNIIIFAVTTSDSASFFAAMQVSNGEENPRVSMRLLWGVVIGFTGIMFQLTGGFDAIRSLAIVVGAPFFFVGIAYMFSVYRMLKSAKKGGVKNSEIGSFSRGLASHVKSSS